MWHALLVPEISLRDARLVECVLDGLRDAFTRGVSPSSTPATVRFDADVLGLAKVLVALRPDVTCPGDPTRTTLRRMNI